MATRRRGGADLDDLKARLGFAEGGSGGTEGEGADESSSSDFVEPSSLTRTGEAGGFSEPSSLTRTDAGAGGFSDAPSVVRTPPPAAAAPAPAPTPAPARPAPAAPAAPAPRPASAADDFANAVHHEPDHHVEYDAHAVDPTLKAPGLGRALPVVLTAVAALAVGVVFGHFGSSTNAARVLVNQQTSGATNVLGALEPIGTELAALAGTLNGVDLSSGYSEAFDTAVRTAYAETPPVLDANQLLGGGPLLSHDADRSRLLISFAIRSQYVASLVGSHIRKTEVDLAEIQREIAAAGQAQRGVGIAFPLLTAVDNYNAWSADPATVVFRPSSGERVEFDTLELTNIADPANPTAPPIQAYSVITTVGQTIQIPPQDLIVLPREQLLPAITTETPLSRYRARAEQLREEIVALSTEQAAIVEWLSELSSRPRLGTF